MGALEFGAAQLTDLQSRGMRRRRGKAGGVEGVVVKAAQFLQASVTSSCQCELHTPFIQPRHPKHTRLNLFGMRPSALAT